MGTVMNGTASGVRFDLTGRLARCGYSSCGTTVESSYGLWFFEYLGPESETARRKCKHCGTYDVTHDAVNRSTGRPGHMHGKCTFEPVGGDTMDRFYCGCRGTE